VTGKRLRDQHERLREAEANPEICLVYLPTLREYRIPLVSQAMWYDNPLSEPPGHGDLFSSDKIDYCPWSGGLLPGSLKHAKARVLRREFGITDWFPREEELEPEFIRSEAWWVGRGIDVRARPAQRRTTWKTAHYTVRYRDLFQRDPPPGLWRSTEAPPHLCDGMARALDDIRVMITYIPWTREYGFRRLTVDRTIEAQPIRMMKFDYCPWCGSKLPRSLKKRWRDEIGAASRTPNDLPPASPFLSDTWWKNLGL
jgi:hypothetical protein